MAHIRIEVARSPKSTQVFVDGVPQKHLARVDFAIDARDKAPLAQVVLTYSVRGGVEIVGVAELEERKIAIESALQPPKPPATRVEYRSLTGAYFGSRDGFAAWLAEPWWKRMFGFTAHDHRRRVAEAIGGYRPRAGSPPSTPPGAE